MKGFWAQYYIEEEKFGDKWNIIENQSDKKTKIGNTSLYYHDAGYFSTEPDLNGYCGTVLEDFSVKDKRKYLISIENKRAKENLQLLLKKVNWGNADRCQWQEYQRAQIFMEFVIYIIPIQNWKNYRLMKLNKRFLSD